MRIRVCRVSPVYVVLSVFLACVILAIVATCARIQTTRDASPVVSPVPPSRASLPACAFPWMHDGDDAYIVHADVSIPCDASRAIIPACASLTWDGTHPLCDVPASPASLMSRIQTTGGRACIPARVPYVIVRMGSHVHMFAGTRGRFARVFLRSCWDTEGGRMQYAYMFYPLHSRAFPVPARVVRF